MNDGSTCETSMLSARAYLPILQVSVEGNYREGANGDSSPASTPTFILCCVTIEFWMSFHQKQVTAQATLSRDERKETVLLPVLKGQARVISAKTGLEEVLYLILLGVNGPGQERVKQLHSIELVPPPHFADVEPLDAVLSSGNPLHIDFHAEGELGTLEVYGI